MSLKGPKRKGICVYCGEHKRITIDHVPPSCLFSGSSSAVQIEVACCLDCQRQFTFDKDDEYLFTVLNALSEEIFHHPSVLEKRPKIMRSIKNKRKRGFWRHLTANIHPIIIELPSGLSVVRHVFKPDNSRIQRIFMRYIWVFNGHFRRKSIPSNYTMITIVPEMITIEARAIIEARFEQVLNLDPVLESPEFSLRLIEDESDAYHTMWVFTFYKAHNFYCEVYPRPEVINESLLKNVTP